MECSYLWKKRKHVVKTTGHFFNHKFISSNESIICQNKMSFRNRKAKQKDRNCDWNKKIICGEQEEKNEMGKEGEKGTGKIQANSLWVNSSLLKIKWINFKCQAYWRKSRNFLGEKLHCAINKINHRKMMDFFSPE